MVIENGEVLTLVDDEGAEQEVEVLGSLDLENQHYIAVAYLDELEDGEKEKEDLDIFFLQVNENDELSVIENDEEFEKVSSAFEAALEER
ncbi:cyclopropane-fatty-acyl-phospholipid synthase [Paenibacillus sp. Soil522]|nr:cyclopropane-fatty-acyl-phospholipid synthase [Paenibacillus sp. Soil522]